MRLARGASFPIGNYRLDMPISALTGLKEFSQTEYAIFVRRFKGARNFHAPAVQFLNRQWQVDLGTVDSRVYKLAVYYQSERKETIIDVSTDVMTYCEQRLGKPTEHPDTIYTWDMFDGNLVVQFAKVGSAYVINLFETSRMVRTFTPE